jgi:hypothetical protein
MTINRRGISPLLNELRGVRRIPLKTPPKRILSLFWGKFRKGAKPSF